MAEFDLTPIQQLIQKQLQNLKPFEGDNQARFKYGLNQIGFANLFADVFSGECCYIPEYKSWYIREGGIWKKDNADIIVHGYTKDLLALYQLTANETGNSGEDFSRFVSQAIDFSYQTKVINHARSDLSSSLDIFDNDPLLLNFNNGVFDLKTHTFRGHSPDDRFLLSTKADYDKDAKSSRWISFINEIMMGSEKDIKYLQKALSLSLIGQNEEECMFIFYGPTTRNGKSTLMESVHRALGDYAATISIDVLLENTLKGDGQQASPEIAKLKGKRMVVTSEAGRKSPFKSETIKKLTGNDSISARKLHGEPFTFIPQFTIYMGTNYLPRVDDRTLFESRRLRTIEFKRHFENGEQDKGLKAQFRESPCISAILNWLIEGYGLYSLDRILIGDGLKDTENTIQVVSEYRQENDTVYSFIEEQCEKSGKVDSSLLYNAYVITYPLSKPNKAEFNRQIKMLLPSIELKKSNGAQIWHGLSLKVTSDKK